MNSQTEEQHQIQLIDKSILEAIQKLSYFSESIRKIIFSAKDPIINENFNAIKDQISNIFFTVDKLTDTYQEYAKNQNQTKESYAELLKKFDKIIATLENDIFDKIIQLKQSKTHIQNALNSAKVE